MNIKVRKQLLSFILLLSMVFGQFATTVSFANNIQRTDEYAQITEEEFKEKVLDAIEKYSPESDENTVQLSGLFDTILDKILGDLNFGTIFERIMKSVDGAISGAIDGIRGTITDVVDSIGKNTANTIVGSIREITDGVAKTIIESIGSIGYNIRVGAENILKTLINDGISQVADNIGKITGDFLENLFRGPISGIGKGIGESIGAIMEGLKVGVDAGIINIDKKDKDPTEKEQKYDILVKEIKAAKAKLEELLKETLGQKDLTDEEKVEVATAIVGSIEILNEFLKVIDANLAENANEITNIDKILEALVKNKVDNLKDKNNEEDKKDKEDKDELKPIDASFIRINGDDRYETSVKAAKTAYPDGVNRIVLASGENYADALSANSLVATYDSPIILTEKGKLPPLVKNYIESNILEEVFIVGGENSVSNSIEKQLKNLNLKVKRISGNDRFETSLNITKYTVGDKSFNNLIIANGNFFADALAASSASARFNIPILLTNGNGLNNNIKNYLNGKDIENLYIVGGTSSVGNSVKDGLKFHDIKRLAGSNRVETSIAVANEFFEDKKDIVIASGDSFPDALAAGAISRKRNAPLILNVGNNISKYADNYIRNNNIKSIYAVGGLNSIPKSIEDLTK